MYKRSPIQKRRDELFHVYFACVLGIGSVVCNPIVFGSLMFLVSLFRNMWSLLMGSETLKIIIDLNHFGVVVSVKNSQLSVPSPRCTAC